MSRSPVRQPWVYVAFSLGANFLVTAAILADTDPKSAELDGVWKLVSVETEGEARQLDEDVRWVIKKGMVAYGGEPLATLACYATSTPKGIDLAFHEPRKEYEGIYVIDADRLKVCLNVKTSGPKERPFDFATRDKPNVRVLTFERVAPADEGPGPQKGYVGVALAAENNGQDIAIQMVLEKSPAEKAGLRVGDVILSIGDENATDLKTTVDTVRRKMPGSELRIRVRREGKEKEITVKVGVFPFSFLGVLD
jgi:uncharacterized protein (TIGR03067 family)